jgi:hypothetical protein
MGLAPYFSRIHDSVGAVSEISADELAQLLLDVTVHVEFGAHAHEQSAEGAAALLVTILARLYPRIRLSGPEPLVRALQAEAMATNPDIEFAGESTQGTTTLRFGVPPEDGEASLTEVIDVSASGWQVRVDPGLAASLTLPADQPRRPASVLAWHAAACIGAAEVFRDVFRDVLGRQGRHQPQPGSFNVLDGDAHDVAVETELGAVILPPLHLAGAGAIGQAALLTLRNAGVRATVTVVDPETVQLSNLQRYVMSELSDLDRLKVDVARERLEGSGVTVVPVATRWGQDGRSHPRQQVVLVALDSARDRLGVAAGLHAKVYNAWTQPSDLGWSRHENTGTEPCLACLYLPSEQRPSEDEQIAAALGQHRLRILSYFVTNVTVGEPLPVVPQVGDVPPPPDTDRWLTTSLLDDLVLGGRASAESLPRWTGARIRQLYQEGVCGAGLLPATPGARHHDVVVPLAHQSALAGVMLATSVIAAHVPELQPHRAEATEMRLDLMTGFPQILARPRARTPGCICADPYFLALLT